MTDEEKEVFLILKGWFLALVSCDDEHFYWHPNISRILPVSLEEAFELETNDR